jgi:inhibitor of the pro-sigma K processing machinery
LALSKASKLFTALLGGQGMNMVHNWWLAAGTAVVLLLLIYCRPWRLLGRLLYSVVVGLVLVGGFNLAAPYVGVSVPLNAVTVLVTGLVGLPGLAALVLLQMLV